MRYSDRVYRKVLSRSQPFYMIFLHAKDKDVLIILQAVHESLLIPDFESWREMHSLLLRAHLIIVQAILQSG